MSPDRKKHNNRKGPLQSSVEECLELYFKDLNGHDPVDIYHMVISEVEPVMLKSVLRYAEGNQTYAAQILGINRTTLRKKLRQYEIVI